MPQLDPTWFASQLFWLVVSMAFLYAMLSRFILPPLMGIIEQRQAQRESDLASAQARKEEAETAKQEYELALQDARFRAQAIMAEAEQAGKQATEKAVAELNRTLNAKIAEAEKRIGAQSQEMLSNLQASAADLAAQIVENLAGVKVDPARAKAAVQSTQQKA